MSSRYNCQSGERYTPEAYVEAGRYVLGAIDLDPASCAAANRIVKATRYFTASMRGELRRWAGRCWLNPPGEQTGQLVRTFWLRANGHALLGPAGSAVLWAGYNLEQLRSLQVTGELDDGRQCPSPARWPRVVIGPGAPHASSGGRIYWLDGDADLAPLKAPMHGNWFALLSLDAAMVARFRERFGAMGDYYPPAAAARDLEAEVIQCLQSNPGISGAAAARHLGARKSDVLSIVRRIRGSRRGNRVVIARPTRGGTWRRR